MVLEYMNNQSRQSAERPESSPCSSHCSSADYLNIGLDYDKTYTADPALWEEFIHNATLRGHRVWIVTARRDTEENRGIVVVPSATVVFTGLAAKPWFMQHKRDVKIDIWIDDDPLTCAQGH